MSCHMTLFLSHQSLICLQFRINIVCNPHSHLQLSILSTNFSTIQFCNLSCCIKPVVCNNLGEFWSLLGHFCNKTRVWIDETYWMLRFGICSVELLAISNSFKINNTFLLHLLNLMIKKDWSTETYFFIITVWSSH